jgi:DNA-binding MarR family transcriptional regulator
MTHFHVLTLLCHHDAMPMGRLADVMGVSMSNATGIIDRMEERGLVERSRVPGDRRVVLVRPTQAGHDLVDEAELIKSDLVTNAIGRLADDQLEDLARVINALREAVDAEMAAHAGLQPHAAPCGHPDHGPAAAPSVVPARHPGA